MKRNLYLFFFLMAVLFAPQAMAGTFPTISTSSKTVWYYLRFTKGDYVLTGSSVGQPCIASFAARREYQLWKVEGTSAQGYTLTNQLGLRVQNSIVPMLPATILASIYPHSRAN